MAKKGKHMTPNQPLQQKIDKGTYTGAKMQLDPSAPVVAKGLIIANDALAAKAKKKVVDDLEMALIPARVESDEAEALLVLDFNLGVDKVNEIYPHNEAKITGMGIDLTEENHKRPLPGKIMGGSVVQSDHSGKGNMHCHSEKEADTYVPMETQSTDILNEAVYYPANPTSFSNSKCGEVIPKDKDVKTTWRIFGRNTTGDGPWSDPFGGFPIH